MVLIYGSVCSGIEAASVAWHPLGWSASFLSEIEPFPRAVLQHHYPKVPLHGDFTTIQKDDYEAIDLLVGGTPCQAFSIAGPRGGLADPRGNLAFEYLRLASRLRPRWLVWENVPGVLSSGDGRDFGAFLGALAELGYGFSYRILNAEHFGVPQRRRRVFVIAYLGDWRPSAAVLFEPASMQWNSPPIRRERLPHATKVQAGTEEAFGGGHGHGPIDVATTCNANGCRKDFGNETFVLSDYCTLNDDDLAHTLRADGFDASEDGTGRGTPLVSLRSGIRRLVPVEVERLQGFPDGYTDVPYKGKRAPDGPRYKAIGNSFCVPVVRWIGQRIDMVQKHLNTLHTPLTFIPPTTTSLDLFTRPGPRKALSQPIYNLLEE